jgi:hypothetical protein
VVLGSPWCTIHHDFKKSQITLPDTAHMEMEKIFFSTKLNQVLPAPEWVGWGRTLALLPLRGDTDLSFLLNIL